MRTTMDRLKKRLAEQQVKIDAPAQNLPENKKLKKSAVNTPVEKEAVQRILASKNNLLFDTEKQLEDPRALPRLKDGSRLVTTRKRRKEWVEPFIKALRDSSNIRVACHVAGITRQNYYAYAKKHPKFVELCRLAIEDSIDLLEGCAFKRALDGSDYLTTFMLKAKRPEVFSDSWKESHKTNNDLNTITITQLLSQSANMKDDEMSHADSGIDYSQPAIEVEAKVMEDITGSGGGKLALSGPVKISPDELEVGLNKNVPVAQPLNRKAAQEAEIVNEEELGF